MPRFRHALLVFGLPMRSLPTLADALAVFDAPVAPDLGAAVRRRDIDDLVGFFFDVFFVTLFFAARATGRLLSLGCDVFRSTLAPNRPRDHVKKRGECKKQSDPAGRLLRARGVAVDRT